MAYAKQPCAPAPMQSAGRRHRGAIPGLLTRLVGLDRIWRQRRHLGELPDSLLDDLGLTRGDVARETQRRIWDVPPTWLR